MKWLKSYSLILVFLFLTSPTLKFSQQIEESTRFKGVQLLVKDDQSGKAEIINLYKKVFAVIIGIDLYKNLSPDRHLRYPVSDAKAIEKMMRERFVFDEIITLYNNEATREAIMAVLMGRLSLKPAKMTQYSFFLPDTGILTLPNTVNLAT
jgi:hypothetical protein